MTTNFLENQLPRAVDMISAVSLHSDHKMNIIGSYFKKPGRPSATRLKISCLFFFHVSVGCHFKTIKIQNTRPKKMPHKGFSTRFIDGRGNEGKCEKETEDDLPAQPSHSFISVPRKSSLPGVQCKGKGKQIS